MRIAFVTGEGRGETDRLLAETATRLEREGARLAGIVKSTEKATADDHFCNARVRVLPDGPVIAITQDLGAGSAACRLDPAGIAAAVAAVEGGSLEGAALFLLNKFGPEESAGRGFCSAIGTALEHDIPVLVGVGAANRAAFEGFAGGLAQALPADADALYDWCRAAIADTPAQVVEG